MAVCYLKAAVLLISALILSEIRLIWLLPFPKFDAPLIWFSSKKLYELV